MAILLYLCLSVVPTLAVPIFQQYNNTAGLLSHFLGPGFSQTGKWSLVTSINVTDVRYKLEVLNDVYAKVDKMVALPQEKIFRNFSEYADTLLLMQNDLETLTLASLNSSLRHLHPQNVERENYFVGDLRF